MLILMTQYLMGIGDIFGVVADVVEQLLGSEVFYFFAFQFAMAFILYTANHLLHQEYVVQNNNLIVFMKAKSNEVQAVRLGFPVTASSFFNAPDCRIWMLDDKECAWSAAINNEKQWIQVSSIKPELWIGVVTQGRHMTDQWVSEYRVQFSMDGETWMYVDEGRVFIGNNDRDTKIRNDFKRLVQARTIRICPLKWKNHISFRFEAIFIET